MRTIWHSLAWKEWHEHKWKLVSIAVILWGTASLAMLQHDTDMFGLAAAIVMLCSVPLAVFIGLGAAANERSRGTLAFLQALPVPMWRVALAKCFFGLVSLVVPIAAAMASFYVWKLCFDLLGIEYHDSVRGMRGSTGVTGNWWVDLVLMSVLVATSLFIWAAATGVNRKDEVSAGAVALAVIVGWWLLVWFAGYILFGNREPNKWLTVFGYSTAPAGFVPAGDMAWRHGYLPLCIFTAAITHFALAAWYVRRFGRIENVEVRSPQVAVRDKSQSDWLGTPWRTPATAIAWKQFRESGPLVLAGLAGVIGIVALILAGNLEQFFSQPRFLAELFAGVSVSLGFGVAMIVGIGICLNDVGPKLSTFWRSRPVNPDLWFWSKFLTGLAVLLAAVYVPLVAIVLAVHPNPHGVLFHPNAMIMPTAHLAIFAAAVAMTCLVRHAVYAAILSIPILYLGIVLVWGSLRVADAVGWIESSPGKLSQISTAQAAAGLVLSFVLCTLLAWLAMRYDWGRKSRY